MGSGKQLKLSARRDQLHDQENGLTRELIQSIVSQQEIVLPDADELGKYQKLDPGIVQWLMDHASQEQSFRHQSHNRKLTIRELNAASDRRLNGWGMFCGLLIFLGGMGLSGLLVYLGHSVAGPIFGGVTLIGGAALFVNRNSADKSKAPPNASEQEPPA